MAEEQTDVPYEELAERKRKCERGGGIFKYKEQPNGKYTTRCIKPKKTAVGDSSNDMNDAVSRSN